MKTFWLKYALCITGAGLMSLTVSGQGNQKMEQMETGVYEPTWESLSQYEVPDWFRDAKFGIWAHWGPQCEPESGDWYARHMYYPGEWQYNVHCSKYGNPSVFGFKDVIHEWEAEKWDPDSLIRFYKNVGARYFMALANHHDNFDLWDSEYQPWNSVNMGPKRNIVGEWAEMCKKYGLPLGVSIHASHAWTWMEGAQDFDGKLTKEDGVGKWWEGYDPQDLYAQNHERSVDSKNVGAIHAQWEWGKGASQPSEAYKTKLYNRTLEVINKYDPDMVYFDDTAVPFYPVSDEGVKIVTHLYNKSLKENDGEMRAVVMGKKLTEQQKDGMIWDVERGIPDRMQEKAWQTCTCLGQWHYDRGVYDRNGYKSASTVVKMLVDIVSKNGNLLLSVPVRGNGEIDEKEVAILKDIKKWMDVNGKSIYGTRPWTTFGEGPTAEASNPINNQGFNEGTNYTSDDLRFVQRHDSVYVTAMGWPKGNKIVVKSLSTISPYYSGKVKEVKLLGYDGQLEFVNDAKSLTVTLPVSMSSTIAPVLLVTFTDEVAYADLDALRMAIAEKMESVKDCVGSNTGKYDPDKMNSLQVAYEEAVKVGETADAGTLADTYLSLRNIFSDFTLHAQHRGGLVQQEELTQNVTVKYLKEARHFSRKDEGIPGNSRFGILDDPWMVSPNILNQDNFTRGGFDGYLAWNDFSGKAIGIQKWEASLPAIKDGKIYQTVTLPAGDYHLRVNVHEQVNFKPGELYTVVARGNDMLNTADVEQNALAFHDLSKAVSGRTYKCCEFTLSEETEVTIGWSVNLDASAAERSMRISAINLYQGTKNVSSQYLGNYMNIRRKDRTYRRFGIPAHWETNNFNIPQSEADGTKQGIDKYPGYHTLMMGIWKDQQKAVGDLSNATLYRQVTLPAGKYFFGAAYEALYQIQEGYLFASKELPTVENINRCLSCASSKDAATGDGLYGITFTLTEETTLYLGWLNNFKDGSETQEFRVKEVTLLRYLDSAEAWETDEALFLEKGRLSLAVQEWAKIMSGTYSMDNNNVPYLATTSEMKISLGQIDLTDVEKVSVQVVIPEEVTDEAAYLFSLDGADTPWITAKPEKELKPSVVSEIEAEAPKTTGVHDVKLRLKDIRSNIYSVTFKNGDAGEGGDGSSVENVTKLIPVNVNVYTLQGVMLKSNICEAEALDGLPGGIYIVNGRKILK